MSSLKFKSSIKFNIAVTTWTFFGVMLLRLSVTAKLVVIGEHEFKFFSL